jgi:hypothetical protein
VKSLSEADIKKIDDVTQTAVNAALAKDFATWASLFLDDVFVCLDHVACPIVNANHSVM